MNAQDVPTAQTAPNISCPVCGHDGYRYVEQVQRIFGGSGTAPAIVDNGDGTYTATFDGNDNEFDVDNPIGDALQCADCFNTYPVPGNLTVEIM